MKQSTAVWARFVTQHHNWSSKSLTLFGANAVLYECKEAVA
jgi:hypothetical protein